MRQVGTLCDALRRAAETDGSCAFELAEGAVELSWREVLERAQGLAGVLAARGVRPGDSVGLAGPNRPEWIVGACATWLAGAAVVPVQIPLRLRDRERFRQQVERLVGVAGCRAVLASPAHVDAVPDGLALAWDADGSGAPAPEVAVAPDDLAVIQFTSGSTAAPRGAAITHHAVIAQMLALTRSERAFQTRLRIAGWTPFFHDLGLFMTFVLPLYATGWTRILPTERFARDPAEWFRMIERDRSTVTVAPASAWALALRRALRAGDPVDLSTLRFAAFGAEGVDPATVDALHEQARAIGLDPLVLSNTYGLAEAVLCVTGNPSGDGLRFDSVDPVALAEGRAEPASGAAARRILSAGGPGVGFEVRIVRDGEPAPERTVGEIQVRGESRMRGYVGTASEDPFVDGWLRTGDLGYLADGQLYVTGRIKDVLVVMGHNHHPEELEWAAGRVDGVKAGRCVALDAGTVEEPRIVLLVEASGSVDPEALAIAVRNAVADTVALTPDEVRVVPRGTIELTTSGKLRRHAMRDAYLRGELPEVADVVRSA